MNVKQNIVVTRQLKEGNKITSVINIWNCVWKFKLIFCLINLLIVFQSNSFTSNFLGLAIGKKKRKLKTKRVYSESRMTTDVRNTLPPSKII